MSSIFDYRRKYGECYVSVLQDGSQVPWKPLNLQEFLYYDTNLRAGRLPAAILEDEIVQKCVLDKNYTLNIDLLEAGVVTTVATQILLASGPESPYQIINDLNIARLTVNNFLHDSAALICQVFPSYKISELLNLPYQEFLEVLALAERRLMSMGVITQPIQPQVVTQDQQPRRAPVQFADLNPSQSYEQQPQKKQNKDVVITQGDMSMGTFMVPPSNNPQDAIVYGALHGEKWKQDAIEGLEHIYPELMAKVKKGEKVTPDLIKQTRGQSVGEVKNKYKKYTENLLSGKIKPEPSKPLIAYETEEGAKPSKPKVKRTRR